MNKTSITKEVKEKISQNLKKLDIPAIKLAKMADVPYYEMRNIVNGAALPTMEIMRKLSEALNVTLNSLVE